MKKIVVFTGAGVSAESGIPTFRDRAGLWEQYNIEDVSHPNGWKKNPELVLDFYNEMRKGCKKAEPNDAHRAIAALEKNNEVVVITQNVDDLHERGGSSHSIHLHGELLAARSEETGEIIPWEDDITLKDKAEDGSQLRPHIVWFEEMPYGVEEAQYHIAECDILIIVGTSLMIGYTIPLLGRVSSNAEVYYIDPKPSQALEHFISNITYIKKKATEGMAIVQEKIL